MILRKRSSSDRMRARRKAKLYRRKRAMRGGRRLSGPLSMASKQAVRRLGIRGFYKRIAKLYNSIDLPTFGPGLVEADASVLRVIFEAAAASSDIQKFVELFGSCPEYTGTKAGVAALAFEAYLAEQDEACQHFVETILEEGSDHFTAVFHGPLSEQAWEELQRCPFISGRSLIEFGDHSYETGRSSDLTILECSASGEVPAVDDEGELVEEISESGGVTAEVFERLFGVLPRPDLEVAGRCWESKAGRWIPLNEQNFQQKTVRRKATLTFGGKTHTGVVWSEPSGNQVFYAPASKRAFALTPGGENDGKDVEALELVGWDGPTTQSLNIDSAGNVGSIFQATLRLIKPVAEASSSEAMKASNIIKDQIGPMALFMLGAKKLLGGEMTYDGAKLPGLSFQVGRGPNKVTHVRVVLTPADLYAVEFLRVRGGSVTTLKTVQDVYAEDLRKVLASGTGLAVSL